MFPIVLKEIAPLSLVAGATSDPPPLEGVEEAVAEDVGATVAGVDRGAANEGATPERTTRVAMVDERILSCGEDGVISVRRIKGCRLDVNERLERLKCE